MLVEITNDIYVKSSMAHQAYKFVITHAHEIYGWTSLSIILHSRYPHIGGVTGDVQYDLATLAFKNGENLKIFIA